MTDVAADPRVVEKCAGLHRIGRVAGGDRDEARKVHRNPIGDRARRKAAAVRKGRAATSRSGW